MTARTYDELVELVQQAVPCTCHPAYTERDLVAPDCAWHHGAEVALEELRDAGALVGLFPRYFYPLESYADHYRSAFGDGVLEGQRLMPLEPVVFTAGGIVVDEQHPLTDDELAALERYYSDTPGGSA